MNLRSSDHDTVGIIPSGRRREQDLYVQRTTVCPQKAARNNRKQITC